MASIKMLVSWLFPSAVDVAAVAVPGFCCTCEAAMVVTVVVAETAGSVAVGTVGAVTVTVLGTDQVSPVPSPVLVSEKK